MKKIIVAIALFCLTTTSEAQEVYGEIMKMSKRDANDKAKNLQTRKIATFRVDALNYMTTKARELMPDSTVRMLDRQALAMYEYVDLFMKELTREDKRKKRESVIELFGQVTIDHPRYLDTDKDLVLSYYNNKAYLTRFSLDTDWEKALATIKRILSSL